MDRIIFQQLIEKHLTTSLHAEELAALKAALREEENRLVLDELMMKQLEESTVISKDFPLLTDRLSERLNILIQQEAAINSVKVHNINWRKWIAAAAILVLAIGSGVYYFNKQSYKSNKSSQITLLTNGAAHDILPGTNRAILTLSNGTQKQLSLADNGLQLQSDAVLLTTPKGGQYQAVLPDGSKVWLNAASSIKFPSTFNAKERRVEITGEVYFEIAKDVTKPFKVYTNQQTIEVLGTSFNVNVYNNEPFKTSLIEGAIKINQLILKPGQAYSNGKIITTNIEQDLAWKNSLFNFDNSNLTQLMKQLERWYDIEVVYQDNIVPNIEFGGKMSRNTSLLSLLSGLKDAGVQFQLKDRTLTILH